MAQSGVRKNAHNRWVQSQGLNDRVRNFDVWLFSLDLKTKPHPSKSSKPLQFWEDILFQLNAKRKEIFDLKTQYQSQSQPGRGDAPSPLKSQIEKVISNFQRLQTVASKEVLSKTSPTERSVFNFDINPQLTQSAAVMSSAPSTPCTSAGVGGQSKAGITGRYWSLSGSPRTPEPGMSGQQSRLPVKIARSTSSLSGASSQNSMCGSEDSLNNPASRNTSRENLRLKGSRDSLLPTFQGHSRPEKLTHPDRTNGTAAPKITATTVSNPPKMDETDLPSSHVAVHRKERVNSVSSTASEEILISKSSSSSRIPVAVAVKPISASRSCSDLYSSPTKRSSIPVPLTSPQISRSQSLSSQLTIDLKRTKENLTRTPSKSETKLVPENRSSMTVLVNRKPSRYSGSMTTVTSYHTPLGQTTVNENKKLGEILSKLPRLVKNEQQRREVEKRLAEDETDVNEDEGNSEESEVNQDDTWSSQTTVRPTDVVSNGEKIVQSRLTQAFETEREEEVMIKSPSTQHTRIKDDFARNSDSQTKNVRKPLFTNNIISPNPKEFLHIFKELSTTLIKWNELINVLLPKAKEHLPSSELREHCLTLGNILDNLPEQKRQLLALQLGDAPAEYKVDDNEGATTVTELSMFWRRVYVKLQEWQINLQVRFVEDEEMHRHLEIIDKEVENLRKIVNKNMPNSSDSPTQRQIHNENLNKKRFESYIIESKLDEISNIVSALQKEFISQNRVSSLLEFKERITAIRESLVLEKSRITSFLDSNNSTIALPQESNRDSTSKQHDPQVGSPSAQPATISLSDLSSRTATARSYCESFTGMRALKPEQDEDLCNEFEEHPYAVPDKHFHKGSRNLARPRVQIKSRLQKGLILFAYTLPIDLFFLVLLAAVLLFMTPSCSENSLCRTLDNRRFFWSQYWIDNPPV